MKGKLEVFVGFRHQLLPCTKFPLFSQLPFLVCQIHFPTLMTTMKVWTSYNKFRFGGLNRSLSPNMVRNVNIDSRKNLTWFFKLIRYLISKRYSLLCISSLFGTPTTMLSKEVVVSCVQQLFAQIKIKIKMEKSYMASRGDYKKAIHIY